MIYVILLMVILNKPDHPSADGGMSSIIIAMAISFWVVMARIVRSQIIVTKRTGICSCCKDFRCF